MTRQDTQASPWKLSMFAKDKATQRVLDTLNVGIDELENPIWKALAGLSPVTEQDIRVLIDAGEMSEEEGQAFLATSRQGEALAEKLKSVVWNGRTPNKSAILRAYVLCQTACLNTANGAIGTGDLGTMRQRWYFSKNSSAMGFKFAAQALEQYLARSADIVLVDNADAMKRAARTVMGHHDQIYYKSDWTKANAKALDEKLGRPARIHTWPKAGWGRAYAQLHSAILADLVRIGLTYEELWVRDASRDIGRYSALLRGFHGVLVLEKEGLFSHFEQICAAAGIPVMISMSGANAFSSVEAVLNDSFRNWEGDYKPTPENPLHIFCISDHDYYGIVPVQDGAAAQFERYLPGAVVVHRIGITPQQVRDAGRSPAQAGYEFDVNRNKATYDWAHHEGIWIADTCYALEVEALEPAAYVTALINAIVEAVGGDDAMRKELIAMADPDWYQISYESASSIYSLSDLIARLQRLESWAYSQRDSAQDDIFYWVRGKIGEGHEEDEWRDRATTKQALSEAIDEQTELITRQAFEEHVLSGTSSSWSPVDPSKATAVGTKQFLKDHKEQAAEKVAEVDRNTELMADLATVFAILEKHGLTLED